MLEISLRHRFPGFSLDAEFTAPTPGVTVIFGPSGCGKSTVLAAVAGLLRPDEGQISLDGVALFDGAAKKFVAPEKRRCGVVFQESRLFPHLSVASNLRYGLKRAPRDAEGPGFDEVVSLLGIEALLARRPAALSGGEKQRVALGRALLSRPALLLMDEPLAALDAARKAEVLPYLARLRHRLRIPLLYVTHALDEVDRLADTLVLMQAGRVLAAGPLEELAARTDLPMLAGRQDAGVLLSCRVAAQEEARGLTRLDFPGGQLVVPQVALPLGEAVRLRIQARDVSIATARPEGLSVQNLLPATLAAIEPGGAHDVLLKLAVGDSLLLSRVTQDAVARLGLTPGMPVWALIKAVAFFAESRDAAS
ncbi:molybdenum ABC transporter ATP-binding protein [Roseomonas sp. 18066]|uniref:molybdenum ABC transporter ATP-binding protein n=1 Tax=Roseomonas sp. 18066 TaxID=2681412 RepID=UPI00135A5B27|nr:molybdenum ABC transporter ATP-binding protein [Roseomonas sp. 18066]